MIPPPPTSTLFPYTTLFRSISQRQEKRRDVALNRARPRIRRAVLLPRRSARALGYHDDAPKDFQDRKSTRLNSSHTVISYAVFCLKKKKRKETNLKTLRK